MELKAINLKKWRAAKWMEL